MSRYVDYFFAAFFAVGALLVWVGGWQPPSFLVGLMFVTLALGAARDGVEKHIECLEQEIKSLEQEMRR